MAENPIVLLGVGLLLIFIGILQIGNVRRALKTGIIAVSIRDTGKARAYKRDENPLLYHLNFWPSLIAAIVLPLMGAGCIGFAIFLLVSR
jgi:hypothetical protein